MNPSHSFRRSRSLRALEPAAVLMAFVTHAWPAAQQIHLLPGKNLIGLHVVLPSIGTGVVLSATPLSSGLLALKLNPPVPLPADRQFTFEAVEQSAPVLPGMWSRVVTWDAGGGQLVVRDPGAACRPAAGQPFKVRTARTVSGIFGASLQKGNAETADLVRVPNGTGYTTLYRRDGFISGWRAVGAIGDKSDFPIFVIQGVIVERRAPGSLMLIVAGEPLTSTVTVALDDPLVNANGIAHLSTLFGGIDVPPLVPPKTLAASGLGTALPPCSQTVRPGPALAGADNVLFTAPNAAPPFFVSTRFFFDGLTWFDENGAVANGTSLPPAILIERKLVPYRIRFTP